MSNWIGAALGVVASGAGGLLAVMSLGGSLASWVGIVPALALACRWGWQLGETVTQSEPGMAPRTRAVRSAGQSTWKLLRSGSVLVGSAVVLSVMAPDAGAQIGLVCGASVLVASVYMLIVAPVMVVTVCGAIQDGIDEVTGIVELPSLSELTAMAKQKVEQATRHIRLSPELRMKVATEMQKDREPAGGGS